MTEIRALQKRETVYDWVRLIATILVVLGHSFYLRNQTGLGLIDYSLPEFAAGVYSGGILGLLDRLSHFVYLFHMQLFFLLSGAVLALKPIADLKTLVKSKAKRLLLPYWFYGLLYMLPVKILGGFYGGKTVVQVYGSFFMGREDGHLWFLPALFWCILLFACIRKLLQKWTDNPLAPLAVCLVLAPVFGAPPGAVVQFRTGVSYLSYFAVGYWIQSVRNGRETLPQKLLTTGAALLGTGFFLVRGQIGSFFGVLSISVLILCLSGLCAGGLKAVEKTGVWAFLMRNLFYVYIFHDPMEYLILKHFLVPGRLETLADCWRMTGLRFAGTLVLSLLLGECVCVLKKKFSRRKQPVVA